jgi:hypothetical protein
MGRATTSSAGYRDSLRSRLPTPFFFVPVAARAATTRNPAKEELDILSDLMCNILHATAA